MPPIMWKLGHRGAARVALLAVGVLGCGSVGRASDGPTATDTGAGNDSARTDTGQATDTGSSGGDTAGPIDATLDLMAMLDAAGSDRADALGVDRGTDTATTTDTGVDRGVDTGVDRGVDTGVDRGVDTGV